MITTQIQGVAVQGCWGGGAGAQGRGTVGQDSRGGGAQDPRGGAAGVSGAAGGGAGALVPGAVGGVPGPSRWRRAGAGASRRRRQGAPPARSAAGETLTLTCDLEERARGGAMGLGQWGSTELPNVSSRNGVRRD